MTTGLTLIVVHDAGESNCILPVLNDVLRSDSGKRTVRVLALGQPAISLFEEFNEVLVTPASLDLETKVIDGDNGREQKLTARDMEKVLQAFPPDQVEMVITGMVYMMESQIALAYRETNVGKRVVGIFDSFALWSDDSICARDFTDQTLPSISEIWLCAKQQVVPEFYKWGIKPVVTGSPTLSVWRKEALGDTVSHTREILLREAEATDDAILVTYAGGYGDASYNRSVSTFCEACAENPEEAYQCVFTPHPGYDPSFEAGIFAEHGCEDSVLIVSAELNLTTSQIVVASNASLSQCSTVGGQSVAVGIPHAYVDDSCKDALTQSGLIDTVGSSLSLLEKITRDFKDEGFYISPVSVEDAGVPLDGEAQVLKALKMETG